ncbi:MAG: autotransporter outer membrane beta-barrel domain-containing protein [Deltaproteobacteria bacterium]|jgi:outer membrane autotransporter protein|nr:autotransporter outer membrane beta-barrel domain-containing protein [Deltaproteobacteria bacterium]
MSVVPVDNPSVSFQEIASYSPSSGSLVSSILGSLDSGVSITGPLEEILFALSNSSSQEEAQAILSSMNGHVLAQGVALAESLPSNFSAMLGSILGNEPLNINLYAPAAGSQPNGWMVQASTIGRWGSGDSVDMEPGYDIKNFSGLIALYHRFNELRIGGALSAGRTEVDWDNQAEAKSTDLSGAFFLRYDGLNWFASVEAFLGQSQMETTRHPGLGTIVEGDYTVHWSGAALKIGRLFQVNSWRLTPRLGINYTHIEFPGFTERGQGLNYIVGEGESDSLELEAGINIAKVIELGGQVFTPHLNLGIAYETQDRQMNLETRFADQPGIPAFISSSAEPGRMRGFVELGGALSLNDNVDVFLDYKGNFRKRDRVHSVSLGVNIYW